MRKEGVFALMIGVFILVLSFSFISGEECVCNKDVGIRYSYSNSYGTGIAIGNESGWFNGNPVKLNNEEYKIKFYVDNKLGEFVNTSATIKIDEVILSQNNFSNINKFSSKEISFNAGNFCNASVVSLQLDYFGDCNLDDNYAERKINVKCEDENHFPICGNGIVDYGEECDLGVWNGFLCWAPYKTSCEYCTSQCKKKIIDGGYCGDGIKDECEECDDGNSINDDSCSNECFINTTLPPNPPFPPANQTNQTIPGNQTTPGNQIQNETDNDYDNDQDKNCEDEKIYRHSNSFVQFCDVNWKCSSWSECTKGNVKTRTCTDTNNCEIKYDKPIEELPCEEKVLWNDENANSKNKNWKLGMLLLLMVGLLIILLAFMFKR